MLTIYYDGECPFCKRFTSYLRLKESVGEVALVNVRADDAAREALQAKGFDLDDGMVVLYGDHYYHGDAALNKLALVSSDKGWFNKLNGALFSRSSWAKKSYPLLRAGRNATLFMMGRDKIAPSAEKLDNVQLFSFFYGLFAVYHFIIYMTRYMSPMYFSTLSSFLFGLLLMLNPRSKPLFIWLTIALLVDGYMHAPIASNHTIIKNFFVFGALLIGLQYWLLKPKSGWRDWFDAIAPLGRGLLIGMYFFGIFHKINTGFLNPETSCAVELLKLVPLGAYFAEYYWAQMAAIYGTFIVEGAVALMLLNRRTRYYGIIGGVLFHMLLASSAYEFYPTFSLLAILLHVLFLPQGALQRFRHSPSGISLLAAGTAKRNRIWLISLVVLQLIGSVLAMHYGRIELAIVPWFAFAIPILIFIIIAGKEGRNVQESTPVISSNIIVITMLAAFFINGFGPYLGIKTRQAINMFANLHVEGGRSNHLIMTQVPLLSDRTKQVVTITQATPNTPLFDYKAQSYDIVYYEMLKLMQRYPDMVVSYELGGKSYEDQSYATKAAEIEKTLDSPFVRKWMHFAPVDMKQPKRCSSHS